ncbi:hypothetical protein [Ulvibacterium sp.]|uniref:hypothetical protein n=1 Tax=Ulvibacterium sp. TaxID=2665914 RepID=UPI003BAA91C2
MKLLKRIFDFYLDASIHVALSILSLLWVTSSILHIPTDKHLFSLVFFGSIACYNFIKYGLEVKKYIRLADRYHGYIQFFSFVCLGIAVYHLFFLEWNTIFMLGILGLFTGLYALPVLPKTRNLRSLAGFKIFPVAIVWAGTTVILPVVAEGLNLSWDVWVETIQRFMLVLALIIPFEIRDMAYDPPELKTLPRLYGVVKTKILGILLIFSFFFLTFLKDETTQNEVLSKAFLFLGVVSILMLTRKDQNTHFSAFWVEAIPFFWWVLIWIME